MGGLARWSGSRWTAFPSLQGQNMTALASDDSDGLFVATRSGVWHLRRDGALTPLEEEMPFLDRETQALCKVSGDLWIGTRTGLFFGTDRPLR